ncbi:MAG: hypothetical protein PF487_14125 [Bacteroidales bacterium]|jgi:hypothetical protein|nr:hypothetical protein [Bacteroidales bacterium]
MKRINYLAFFLLAAVVLSSCGGLEKMKEEASDLTYSVTPKVLEMHGDVVKYSIKGDVPAEWFNKKAVVEFTPVLKYNGEETILDSKTFQGEKVEANNKVIAYETGGSIEFIGDIPYNENMRVAELEMRAVATIKDKNLPLVAIKLADGVVSTSTLVQNNPMPILLADKFQRVISNEKDADIHYLIQRSNIKSSELSAEDIQLLEEFVKEANEKENYDFKGVEISSYASPDGPLKLNEKLSVNRKESADKYLANVISKAKVYKHDAESLYNMKTTAEDWNGFKTLVEKSEIEDKNLILRVLSMYSDNEVREKEIKNIAATYKVLADEILPKLRRSDIKVKVDITGYSDEELLNFAKTNPDTLNIEELLYAGKIETDLDNKLAIFESAAKNYDGCYRAFNNVGYVNILNGNLDDAKIAIEKANELKEGNASVINNLGVIALMEGDKEAAEDYFVKATDAGNTVDYNLGIIRIMDGEYDAAVNYFQNHKTFNTALAMLLAGKTDNAIKTIDVLDDGAAINYYLKAVCGARKADDNIVLTNMRSAITKDATFKELAKTDLEFYKYFENDAFKTIVE